LQFACESKLSDELWRELWNYYTCGSSGSIDAALRGLRLRDGRE
jgi:hypothetical protein